MVLGSSVAIYSRTSSINNEGMKTFVYNLLETKEVNLQPYNLTEADLKEFGTISTATEAKRMIYEPGDFSIKKLMRVITIENVIGFISFPLTFPIVFSDMTFGYYEIRKINNWPNHSTAILIPVQGVNV